MHVLMLLVSVLAASHAWILEANIGEITPGSSRSVTLVCRQDMSPANAMIVDTITRIRITKLDPFGSKTTFTEIRKQTNVTSNKYDKYTVEGRMDKIEDAFLKVTWPVATKDTAGAYGCQIDGFDSLSNFVNLKASPKLIKEKVITIDDLKNLIQSTTFSIETKQQALELEISKLKSLFEDDLKSLKQQMQKKVQTLKSEMTRLREITFAAFATKDELSVAFSVLKNFTRDEIISDNHREDEQHKMLLNSINNMNKSSHLKIIELKTDLTNANIILDSKIEKLDQENGISILEMNSTLGNLRTQIKTINHKCENGSISLRKYFEKKISEVNCKCPITTPSETTDTTTPTTPRVHSVMWPEGAYSLVKPRSGCPALKYYKVVKPAFAYHKFFNVKVDTISGDVNLIYCQQGAYSYSPLSSWPKGSYCVAKANSNCPGGFTEGSFRTSYWRPTTSYTLETFQSHYCCRSDGTAQSPITLPTEKPFYLYRYKGVCQTVQGMKVRQESVKIGRTVAGAFRLTLPKAEGTAPDSEKRLLKPISVFLCYYYHH